MRKKGKQLVWGCLSAANRARKSLRSCLARGRARLHLYKKVKLPCYDARILQDTWAFHSTKCVSEVFSMPEETLYDVSVIVPLYNSEKYLPGLLGELAGQQGACSYEILLVDDGSADATPELLRQYQEGGVSGKAALEDYPPAKPRHFRRKEPGDLGIAGEIPCFR